MFSTLIENLRIWDKGTDAHQKLQHSYLVLALALVLIAGILGLINYDLGQRILLGAFIVIVVFLFNAVAWALLQSFVLLRIPKAPRATSATKRKK